MFPKDIDWSVKPRPTTSMAAKVVVALKVEKVISKNTLAWALNHIVRPGDCITLLAVFSGEKTGKRFWNLAMFGGDCASSGRETLSDRISEISETCSHMVLQFHNQIEVTVRIKVVLGTPVGVVAAEAKRTGANWVVLDKKLKQEQKHCLHELNCNIVVIKGSQSKVLRLNLGCSDEFQTSFFSAASSPVLDVDKLKDYRMKHSTPVSSPEETNTFYTGQTGKGLLSSFDSVTSLFLVYEQNPLFEGLHKGNYRPIDEQYDLEDALSPIDLNRERLITLSKTSPPSIASTQSVLWGPKKQGVGRKPPITQNYANAHRNRSSTSKALINQHVQYNEDTRDARTGESNPCKKEYSINSNIRDAVSLGRMSSTPPPLCSLCQHKTPAFGKPPKQFSYDELEIATEGFADTNFLAEGGFGVVHRGVLRDGEVVAVKQLKFGGSEADADFCREVRVLSCAQHRNVVMLIGYCIEEKMRMLVYEYICNESLDFHLHGNKTPLDWHSRLKIATGTARGLRYLHEDCRVGCIVHRDLRPKNILLTHDFEPLVADFGLARWYSEWDISTEDRILGTSGYLAPEYVDGGQISQKVDVYAFGVVLLELIAGQKVTEMQYALAQHSSGDWHTMLAALEPNNILPSYNQLLDPNVASDQSQEFLHQLQAIGRAASLCLRRDPESRPPMSKVLRVLEGGDVTVPLSSDPNTVGSRSAHFLGLNSQAQVERRINHARRLSH